MTPRQAEKIAIKTVLRLRRERERQKVSKYALAEMTGLHQSTIGLVESGERNPTLYTLLLIAGALDVSLGDIVWNAEGQR